MPCTSLMLQVALAISRVDCRRAESHRGRWKRPRRQLPYRATVDMKRARPPAWARTAPRPPCTVLRRPRQGQRPLAACCPNQLQPRTPQPPTSPPPPRPSPPKASPTTSTRACRPVHRCRRVPKRSRTMRCTLCKRRRLSTPSPCIPLRWRLPLGHPYSKPRTPHTLPSTRPCHHHPPMPRRQSSPRPPHRRPCRSRRHRRPQHPRAHFRPTARTFGPPPPLPPAHLRCR